MAAAPPSTDARARLLDARTGGGAGRARAQRRAARLAARLAAAHRAGEVRGRRADACATGSTAWRCCTASRSLDGRVSYGNRFLESRAYRAAREHGRSVYGEFATDPCRSLFKRVQTLFAPGSALTDNANVNVARLGERFVAMTETPLPVQFDPHTLQPPACARSPPRAS